MPDTIAVTGANGQLGRLVIAELLKAAPDAHLVGIVRNEDAARDLADKGVELRFGDYDKPETIAAALAGVDKLLLISSSEVGRRTPQHRTVIDAAKAAGVKLLAYTSILRADTNPMILADEHRETEAAIRDSGLPFVFLRNGWYTENYTGSVATAVEHGAVLGSSKDGRIASAARADYAAAAAAVMASKDDQAGKIYELAGDNAFTMADFAEEIARQSGKPVVYNDMPMEAYKGALQGFGLPEPVAQVLADSNAKTADGALYDEGRTLSALIGRPTTPVSQSVEAALAA